VIGVIVFVFLFGPAGVTAQQPKAPQTPAEFKAALEQLVRWRLMRAKEPQTSAEFMGAGDDAFARNGYQEAIRAYEYAVKLGLRDDAGMILRLAIAYNEVGSFGKALAGAEAVIKLDPKSAEAHHERGYAQKNLGDREQPGTPAEKQRYDAAIASYREATRLNPSSGAAFQGLGATYHAAGAFAEAALALAEAVRLIPDDGELRMYLGHTYSSLAGREQDAAAQLLEAVRLDSQNYEAMTSLAQEYRTLGRLPESVEQLRLALRLKPDLADAHAQLALTFAKQGNLAGALDEYRIAERLDKALAEPFAPLLEKAGVNLRATAGAKPSPTAPCPELTVTGPVAVFSGRPITFTVRLDGGTAATPLFNWMVSGATISSGQGTATITVATSGLSGFTTTATVEVMGLAEPCALRSVHRTRILGRGRRGIGIFLAPSAVSPPAVDSNPKALIERGQALYRTGDLAGAVACYRKAAALGNGNAEYLLGLALDAGEGAGQDRVAAVKLFRAAADRGIAGAQFRMATIYFTGAGVETDVNKGLEWLTAAAAQGHLHAQAMLGDFYAVGMVVAQNQAKSIEWYTKAAEQGDVASQQWVGQAYYYGPGVPKDVTKSAAWYRRAADRGDAISQGMLGYLYFVGEGVPKDEAASIMWLTKSADQGYAIAQSMLAGRYRTGQTVAKDAVKAVELFTKAAEQGYLQAQKTLGAMYYGGEGIPRDYSRSAHWYGKAAAQGDAAAQYQIGVMHYSRQGTGADPGQAKEWMAKAAAQGHELAKKALAGLNSGRGLVLDAAEKPGAAKSVKIDQAVLEAAERGDAASQLKLGRMYKNAEGAPKDPVMAYFWFTVAAANGSHEATKERDAIGITLTPGQRSEGFNKAYSWIQAYGRKAQ